MTDIVSPEKRSSMMSGIKGKNTKPEMIIRKGLFARGFRYRLHSKDLSGKPDLVLPKYKAIIFVHGCFWHQHDCKLFKWPKTNTDFWREKITANTKRDRKHYKELTESGWRIMIVWECAIKGRKDHDTGKVLDILSNWILTETNNNNKIREISEGSINGK